MDEQGPPIIGRDRERDRIERFLADPRPAVLLIEGEAGIGKSTLWRHGVGWAERLGFRVLAFRAGEAERSLTFAGLAGLLPDALLDEVLPEVPAPRRRALEAALLREEGPGRAAETGTVGLGVLSVLSGLAERAPLLLAVDDLQWLDEPTVRVLEFAVRRVNAVEIAVLAARRTSAPETGPVPLEPAFEQSRRGRLLLGPLSVGALGRMVRDRLGLALPRSVAARLLKESGGNPFIALELSRAVRDRGALPAPGDPFPVMADAASLVGHRIDRLSPTAHEALLVLSALARPTAELVQRALRDEMVEPALEELVRADLVQVEGHEVRCAHPLIASTAYADALPTRRRELHRRLASVVEDVEERARHLALAASGPSRAVAQTLDEAAALARRRGASDAAAGLAELAVALTSPADRSGIARRELDLARFRLDAGSVAEAREAAARSVETLPPGPGRVESLILLAKIDAEYVADMGSAGRLLDQALREAREDRGALVRAHVAAGHWGVDDFPGGEEGMEAEHARAALDLLAGREHEDPESAATALLMIVEAGFRAGHGLDLALLDRAIELESNTHLSLYDRPSSQGAIGLGFAGKHLESIRAIEGCLVRAEQEDDWGVRPLFLRSLAWMGWCTGNLYEASKHIEQALAIAEEIGLDEGVTWAMGAQIRAAMGRAEEAREWTARALTMAKGVDSWWWELRGRAAIVFLELTAGMAEAAADAASGLRALAERAGSEYEPGWNRIHGDVIEALVGAGRFDEAGETTAWFEARASVGTHPWSLMVSARCRGLLEAAAGRADEALSCFERSLAADEAGEMAFERARTLLAQGQVLRRANRRRAARKALEEARAIFEASGSPPWAERAALELASVGGRVAKATELTAMERRVAELASAGRTNREIGEELFLSVRTVESHLSAAYRKLGVRSRTELASAIAGRDHDA